MQTVSTTMTMVSSDGFESATRSDCHWIILHDFLLRDREGCRLWIQGRACSGDGAFDVLGPRIVLKKLAQILLHEVHKNRFVADVFPNFGQPFPRDLFSIFEFDQHHVRGHDLIIRGIMLIARRFIIDYLPCDLSVFQIVGKAGLDRFLRISLDRAAGGASYVAVQIVNLHAVLHGKRWSAAGLSCKGSAGLAVGICRSLRCLLRLRQTLDDQARRRLPPRTSTGN